MVKTNRAKRLDYGLLRHKIICDYCDNEMEFSHQILVRGKNKGKWSVRYHCRNKQCLRHDKNEQTRLGVKVAKSIRAKYVLAAIEWELRHATVKSREAYELYIQRLETKLATDRAIVRRKLEEAKQELITNKQRLVKLSDMHIDDPKSYEKYHSGKIEHHEQLIGIANQSIESNKNKLKELEAVLPTEEQFFELMNLHLLDMLQTDDIMKLDAICNELVSNLRAGNDSVSVIKLNPPYNLMVDLGNNLSWSRNDDLMRTYLDTLRQVLLNSQIMSENLAKASECVGSNPEATSMNRFLL